MATIPYHHYHSHQYYKGKKTLEMNTTQVHNYDGCSIRVYFLYTLDTSIVHSILILVLTNSAEVSGYLVTGSVSNIINTMQYTIAKIIHLAISCINDKEHKNFL